MSRALFDAEDDVAAPNPADGGAAKASSSSEEAATLEIIALNTGTDTGCSPRRRRRIGEFRSLRDTPGLDSSTGIASDAAVEAPRDGITNPLAPTRALARLNAPEDERLSTPGPVSQAVASKHLRGDHNYAAFRLERASTWAGPVGGQRKSSQVLLWDPSRAVIHCTLCGARIGTGEVTDALVQRTQLFDEALARSFAASTSRSGTR